MRKRLTNAEAEFLGLQVRPDEGNRKKARYTISEEQYQKLKDFKNPTEEKSKPFILSAWKKSGGVMNIDEYCECHSLPREDVRYYKLVSHTGIPFYNIQFREKDLEDLGLDAEFVKNHLRNNLKFKVDKTKLNPFASNIGVVKIADLHYGALVNNLLKTKDYSPSILAEKLEIASMKINRYNFDETHIHIHGHNIVSKRPTKEIIWDYGKQGMFNLVAEGHLHSLIERLSVNQRNAFKTIKDDSLDHRRVVLPSFFTGNSYSEKLNYFSHSGFAVVSSYNGLPEMDYRMV